MLPTWKSFRGSGTLHTRAGGLLTGFSAMWLVTGLATKKSSSQPHKQGPRLTAEVGLPALGEMVRVPCYLRTRVCPYFLKRSRVEILQHQPRSWVFGGVVGTPTP